MVVSIHPIKASDKLNHKKSRNVLCLKLLRAEVAEKVLRPVVFLEMFVEAVHVRELLGLAARHVAAERYRWLLQNSDNNH